MYNLSLADSTFAKKPGFFSGNDGQQIVLLLSVIVLKDGDFHVCKLKASPSSTYFNAVGYCDHYIKRPVAFIKKKV
jgi:hypothetical protein